MARLGMVGAGVQRPDFPIAIVAVAALGFRLGAALLVLGQAAANVVACLDPLILVAANKTLVGSRIDQFTGHRISSAGARTNETSVAAAVLRDLRGTLDRPLDCLPRLADRLRLNKILFLLSLFVAGKIMLLVLTPFALALAAPAMPPVSIVKSGAGHSASAPEFPATKLEAVEAEVRRRAAAICAADPVTWGKFRYETQLAKDITTEVPKVRGYQREFRCGNQTPPKGQRAPDDWQPSPADEAEVTRIFAAYYGHRDRGEVAAAKALFEPDAPTKLSEPDVARVNASIGKGSRRIVAVTWYVNPAQADREGVFAALDFVGNYPAMHFYCGYLMLYRSAPGRYVIVREEQNMFAKTEQASDPAHLAELRATMCRDG